ncbi:MAG: hypothetical protein HONBIEJF_01687 [Fimbriimonadaceae bacterium]|nr:hypothetical protein [Fimbriimonadaceae bacterium]
MPTGAYYLQYFNYSHAAPRPPAAQVTQYAYCSVDTQPADTVVSWTIPSSLYSLIIEEIDENSHLIDLSAETAVKDAEVRANYALSFLADDGVMYFGEAIDITTEVPQGLLSSHMKVRRFSGHLPSALTLPAVFEQERLLFPNDPDTWQCGREYKYKLVDTFGEDCPGVRIQERYTTPIPSGFHANGVSEFWITVLDPANKRAWFHDTDWIRYAWPPSTNQPPNIVLQHQYYAGNTATTGTSGVPLQLFTMTLIAGKPGAVIHSP